jgi:hypothetical protein
VEAGWWRLWARTCQAQIRQSVLSDTSLNTGLYLKVVAFVSCRSLQGGFVAGLGSINLQIIGFVSTSDCNNPYLPSKSTRTKINRLPWSLLSVER